MPQRRKHPHFAFALLNLKGFLWKQNASLENVSESAKMPMRRQTESEWRREGERETDGKRDLVLWTEVNTKLEWVVCQGCRRNIPLTTTLARRILHSMRLMAKLRQSLSNQGPIALNYWAVTSNINPCIWKAHEIIRDIKAQLRSWRHRKWKMANRGRPVLIRDSALSQTEVAVEDCLNRKRMDDEWEMTLLLWDVWSRIARINIVGAHNPQRSAYN